MSLITRGSAAGVLMALIVAAALDIPLGFRLLHPLFVLHIAGSALIEEVLFRSWVLAAVEAADSWRESGRIRSKGLFILLVVLVQGAVFGALHLTNSLSAETFIVTGTSGVIYGFIVWKFRALTPCVAAHAAYNLVVMSMFI